MKKIILLIVIAAIALLPLIGNKLIQNTLDEKIKMISKNGIKTQILKTDSSYLRTSIHYEFVVNDSTKFITYLKQYSDKQIPVYVNMMLEGMHVGMDLSYSNILFNDSLEIDIYPLSLSEQIAKDIQKEDGDFYKYITNFLKIKGLLYHLDYDLGSESFDGYIKDIDEEYTFKDSTNTKFMMSNMIYSGKGGLLHPMQMDSSIGNIIIKSVGDKETLDLKIEDIKSSSKFKTKTTYVTTASVYNIELKTNAMKSSELHLKDINIGLSADTESKKAKFSGTSSFKELSFKTLKSTVSLYDFNYDVELVDINKDAFEELRILLVKAQTNLSVELQNKISNSMLNLLAKGLVLNIKDISVDKVSKNSQKAVDAFSLQALLTITADSNSIKNIKAKPAEFVKTISLDSYMKISKDFFKMINKDMPLSMVAGGFAKEVANDYVFDVKFKDSKLNVNGKAIK